MFIPSGKVVHLGRVFVLFPQGVRGTIISIIIKYFQRDTIEIYNGKSENGTIGIVYTV